MTGKPPLSVATARRKRREETGRAFQKLAFALIPKKPLALIRFMFCHKRHDPEAEQHYAEQVLQTQMEEWTQEEEQYTGDHHHGVYENEPAEAFDLHL